MSKLQQKIIQISEEVNFSFKPSFKTMQKLYKEAENIEELKELFGRYISASSLTVFPSPHGTGKSLILKQILIAVSAEQDNFLGENIERHGNTFYLNLELSDHVIKRRLKKLLDNAPFKINTNYHSFVYTFRTSLLKELPEIVAKIEIYKPIIIVIDNLRLAFVGSDINSGTEMTKLMFALMAIRDATGCAIVLADHFRKHTNTMDSNSHSGSGSKMDLADSSFYIKQSALDKSWRLLKRGKSRNFESSDNVKLIKLNPDTLWFELIEENVNEAEHSINTMTDKNELMDMAIKLKEEGKSLDEIAKILGKGKTTIHRWTK